MSYQPSAPFVDGPLRDGVDLIQVMHVLRRPIRSLIGSTAAITAVVTETSVDTRDAELLAIRGSNVPNMM